MSDGIDVDLKKVSKWFGDICAVKDFSLSIKKGEFFALLGPSGCGKSTVLRMISGLEEPSFGCIRIQGEDMADVPPHRRPTNMVFQHLALFPHLDVYKNLAFGLKLKGLSKVEIQKKISNILKLIQLPGMEARRVNELSGGQQQRVALARALVNEPSVLLLDEALGALDLKLRNSMQLEMKTLRKKLRITFIYVTHDQNEALMMADRIGLMKNGQLEQVGSGYDLYMHPQNEFAAHFIGETNLLRGRITKIEGEKAIFDGEDLRVKTSLQRREGLQVGHRALLSLRPENLLIGYDATEASNKYQGVIQKLIFLGPILRAEISLGEQQLTAHLPVKNVGADIREGQTVTVGWGSDACGLLLERT